jgi:hypothetical protein
MSGATIPPNVLARADRVIRVKQARGMRQKATVNASMRTE